MTTDETITEATETVAFIRRLQLEEAEIKTSLKEKRDEIDQANGHLCHLFEADANDSDRPLLDDQDNPDAYNDDRPADALPIRHTVTAEPGGKARRARK